MSVNELRERLATCNLSLLSRLAGVDLRRLRRIKNGEGDVRTETVERIKPHLKHASKELS
jgi:hypothetical protein